jgi:hypothetical protein
MIWRAFPHNPVGETVWIDFFAVPAATLQVVLALILPAHDRRLH